MAVYTIPTFNLVVNFWRFGNSLFNAPDVVTIGNLSPGRIVSSTAPEGLGISIGQCGMWLRLPINTDVQDDQNGVGADTCECPAGSGRFYTVMWVDDIGGGFGNEHRFAVLQKLGPWPTPFPSPGGPFPPPPGNWASNLTSGNSGGAAVNVVIVPVIIPANRDFFIALNVINQAQAPTYQFLPMPAGAPFTTHQACASGGNTIDLYTVVANSGAGGVANITFKLGLIATGWMQYNLSLKASALIGITQANRTNTGGAVTPQITTMPVSGANISHWGAFSGFTWSLSPTFPYPWKRMNVDDILTVGGWSSRLAVEEYTPSSGGTYNAKAPPVSPVAWSACEQSWT